MEIKNDLNLNKESKPKSKFYCGNCGSSDVIIKSSEYAICINCGCKIIKKEDSFINIVPSEDVNKKADNVKTDNKLSNDKNNSLNVSLNENIVKPENAFIDNIIVNKLSNDNENITKIFQTNINNDGIKNINCNNCGSSNVTIKSNEYSVCNSCGSKILHNQDNIVNIVNKEVHIHNNGSDFNNSLSGNNIYIIEKETISPEEFMKNVYISLTNNKDTPVDILDSEFSIVKKCDVQYSIVKYDYDISFSASIGYDRKEQYEDYEERYDSDLGMNVRRKVIKERTVTDWQPFSNRISGNDIEIISLIEKDYYDGEYVFGRKVFGERFAEYIKNNKDNIIELDDEEYTGNHYLQDPNHGIINESIDLELNYKANIESLNLPGDRHKDFIHNDNHKVTEIHNFSLQQYCIDCKYMGEKFNLTSFLNDNEVYGGNIPNIKEERQQNVDSKLRLLDIISMVGFCSFIIFALYQWFGSDKINKIGTSIYFVIIVIIFILNVVLHKVILNNTIKHNQDEKLERLDEKLNGGGRKTSSYK